MRGDEIIHVHCGGQGQHVAAFLVGDGRLGLGERPGDFLQGQAVFADFDEVVQLPRVLAVQPVLDPDEQAVQPPGQVLVIRRIHSTMMARFLARVCVVSWCRVRQATGTGLVAVQVMPQAAQERLVAAVAVIDGVE